MSFTCSYCHQTSTGVMTDREDGFGIEFCPQCGKVCGGALGTPHIGKDIGNVMGRPSENKPANRTAQVITIILIIFILVITFYLFRSPGG